MPKITIQTIVSKDLPTVWQCYTQPEHITQWNFAVEDWQCPRAENDLRVGGKYFARMEAKDGSFGFDFEAVYTDLEFQKSFTYVFGGREATTEFIPVGLQTQINIIFDAEEENSLELQQQGWQSILNNFKKYAESVE